MNKRSQCTKIAAILKSGPITPLGALRLCGTFRLAARIYDLRELDENGEYINPVVKKWGGIETTMIQVNGARVAQYKLKNWKPTYVEPEGWTPGWTE